MRQRCGWQAIAHRTAAIPARLRALADLGYEGAGIGILVPVKNPAGSPHWSCE
jgi:hypothetical protein